MMGASVERGSRLKRTSGEKNRSVAGPEGAETFPADDGNERRIERLETALDNIGQGLCMFDAQSRLVICNRRYYEIFGLEPGAIPVGSFQQQICRILIERGCYPPDVTIEAILSSTQMALRTASGQALFRQLADGRILTVFYRSLPDGGWVSTFEDITELRHNEARIAYLAHHDPVTDLANSRTLRSDGGSLLRAGPRTPVIAVHHLDIDRFAFVNDTYGHDVGDALLRAVADRLRRAAPRDARIGRLDGDAFGILQRAASQNAALALARRLAAQVAIPFQLPNLQVEISASVGLTMHEGNVADLEPLMQEANLALREAKLADRGTVLRFEPAMSQAALERRSLEAELRQAITGEQFDLHYQPLVDLAGHQIIGVEALLRWHHPDRGLVSPATFIPLAEEIGLIVPIGEWVLRKACRDAATWPEHIGVAVNVSSVQMRQRDFAGRVLEIVAEAGLPPGRLEIEITESALLDESDVIMANLHELRATGIRFAMDDFGTGYSSLSYLRRFPFDKIKIDRSFMKDAEQSADALAIIRSVAGLGMSLGITTLVEGVETQTQLELARAQGVRQAQGYHLSRPKPGPSIGDLIRTGLTPRSDAS